MTSAEFGHDSLTSFKECTTVTEIVTLVELWAGAYLHCVMVTLVELWAGTYLPFSYGTTTTAWGSAQLAVKEWRASLACGKRWQRRRHKYHRNLNDIIIKSKRDDPGLTAPAASNEAWQNNYVTEIRGETTHGMQTGILPGEGLPIDELEYVTGDIKHWLPPSPQHSLRKPPMGGNRVEYQYILQEF